MSALQIKCPDGRWRWVKHMDNALVCSGTVISLDHILILLFDRLSTLAIALNFSPVVITKEPFTVLSSHLPINMAATDLASSTLLFLTTM